MNNLLQSLRGVLSALIGFHSPEDGLLEKARRRWKSQTSNNAVSTQQKTPPTSVGGVFLSSGRLQNQARLCTNDKQCLRLGAGEQALCSKHAWLLVCIFCV